ncbi:MAG: pilus assembly protein PilX [Deltaproteobacteria bacterium HGW-Deltaproteobacteria-23]|nr:MAG: pilus assembly protein PilX [Deltaproteobacteria bacterium HGW-Deltaproteobacteria-23]
MSRLKGNQGMALVTALLFTLISLGIVMMLLYIVTQGTKISAASKNYKSSLEASYGAVEVVTKDLFPAIFGKYTSSASIGALATNYSNVNLTMPALDCFAEKTRKSTAYWDTTLCDSTNKNYTPTDAPDLEFILKSSNDAAGFKVYTKITDTRCGGNTALNEPCTNSDMTGIDYLEAGSGVTGGGGTVTPQHKPAYYNIEVQGERASNPREKSKLSVLYAY